MLEIKDVKIFGIEESMIASGYAMTTEPYDYSEEKALNLPKIQERVKRLSKAAKETGINCHTNWMTGAIVQFDVKYPQYWSPEFQRYHFAQIITSQSKMHKLLRMDLDKVCNRYVDKETIDIINNHIFNYNLISDDKSDRDFSTNPLIIELRDGTQITATSKEDALYSLFMCIVSNCPLGLELWMRVSTNYQQLATIYKQRKNHKLKEDWGAFCDFIRSLPYNELITGDL